MMDVFELNLKEDVIWIEKTEPGNTRPILGWVKNNKICHWLNHLRGLESKYFNIYERPEINEEHITLYKDDELIGWIEKEYKQEILDRLWDYVKHEWSHIDKKDKPGDESEEEKPVETGQLSLF